MPDNINDRGAGDRARINLKEDYEVKYWSEKFAVSAKELTDAVKQVGPMAKDVEEKLKGKSS